MDYNKKTVKELKELCKELGIKGYSSYSKGELVDLLATGLRNEVVKEYIAVPFSEKDNAHRLGARWDSSEKKWHIPRNLGMRGSRDELLKLYKINDTPIEYIAVLFAEKDNAKKLGAKWDSSEKKWYIPHNLKTRDELLKLYTINKMPVELVGEDRIFGGNELFVDLIPLSCWFTNVRTSIHPCDWDRVRNHIYTRVGYICECCGINTKDHAIQIEAHERWNYDDTTQIQKLVRLVALCEYCHQSTHLGFAGVMGKREEAINHLKTVRGFTDSECKAHIEEAYAKWKERNKHKWILDISLILDNGIKINPADGTKDE